MKCEQIHEFHYLLKKDGNDYSMQVMEIPGIIVGGKKREFIEKEIENATKSYLDFHDETHSKAQQNKLAFSLSTSPTGIILGIEEFSVRC
jgi:hypothetical protein